MKRTQWRYSCLLVVAVVTAAQGATFFVDAGSGDDSNTGTAASKPFLTIQKAIHEAALRPGPDLIQIAEGQYVENLKIKDPDSLTLSGSSGVEIVAASSDKDVINITLGDITISDLAVSGGKNGIIAKGAIDAPIYLTLRKVDSVANLGRGMRADDVLELWISACQFLDNENDDGIKVTTKTLDRTAANLSIRDTIISGCGDDGIDLELLNEVRLANVLVQDTAGDDGLSLDDSVSISILGCAFVNSAADGIDIDDTESVSIVSTVSVGNGDAGAQIKAEEDYDVQSVRIVGSEFLDNGAEGLWLVEEDAVIEWANLSSVTATGNGGSGLNITVSGTLKLSAITSENNGAPDVP